MHLIDWCFSEENGILFCIDKRTMMNEQWEQLPFMNGKETKKNQRTRKNGYRNIINSTNWLRFLFVHDVFSFVCFQHHYFLFIFVAFLFIRNKICWLGPFLHRRSVPNRPAERSIQSTSKKHGKCCMAWILNKNNKHKRNASYKLTEDIKAKINLKMITN